MMPNAEWLTKYLHILLATALSRIVRYLWLSRPITQVICSVEGEIDRAKYEDKGDASVYVCLWNFHVFVACTDIATAV